LKISVGSMFLERCLILENERWKMKRKRNIYFYIFEAFNMVVFRQKKIITVNSIGDDLQKARQALNLSIKAVEKKINISENYLKAMETNDWDDIPGEIYRKNFLKKYTEFLAIDFDGIKNRYEKAVKNLENNTDKLASKFGVGRKKFVVFPKIIRNVLIGILIIIIIGYIGRQILSLLSPPKFDILYPEEKFITNSVAIKILGFVNDEAWIGLNDNEISVGTDGYFTVDIDLNPGLNIIKFEARKRYGRSKIIYRRIIAE